MRGLSGQKKERTAFAVRSSGRKAVKEVRFSRSWFWVGLSIARSHRGRARSVPAPEGRRIGGGAAGGPSGSGTVRPDRGRSLRTALRRYRGSRARARARARSVKQSCSPDSVSGTGSGTGSGTECQGGSAISRDVPAAGSATPERDPLGVGRVDIPAESEELGEGIRLDPAGEDRETSSHMKRALLDPETERIASGL